MCKKCKPYRALPILSKSFNPDANWCLAHCLRNPQNQLCISYLAQHLKSGFAKDYAKGQKPFPFPSSKTIDRYALLSPRKSPERLHYYEWSSPSHPRSSDFLPELEPYILPTSFRLLIRLLAKSGTNFAGIPSTIICSSPTSIELIASIVFWMASC